MIGNEGFGTVFDGTGNGFFENLSTQAVLDLVRNVRVDSEDGNGLVEIGTDEIENFNLNPSESVVQDALQIRKFCDCLNKCLFIVCFFNRWML